MDGDGYDLAIRRFKKGTYARNVWNILHGLHDYDIDDIERDLDRLERIINEDKLHNDSDWRTRLREILLRLRANKIRDIDIMKEYDKILRSLEPHEYIIISRAIVRLMGNRTRELLKNPVLYQRLRKAYQQTKEDKKK